MFFNTLAVSSVLLAASHVFAEPAPYRIGSMSLNNAFGLGKRQSGYSPTQTFCGPGTDCPSSCGVNYITCPSADGDLHCFDPTIKETCCPDGSGNSCDEGYYCTSDSTGGTWCCPDGMNLAACAAAYSLTDALVSQIATATASVSAISSSSSSSAPASVSGSATSTSSTAAVATSSTSHGTTSTTAVTEASVSSSVTAVTHVASATSSNSTVTSTSSALPLQVTSGANAQAAFGGVPALLFAAGALFAL